MSDGRRDGKIDVGCQADAHLFSFFLCIWLYNGLRGDIPCSSFAFAMEIWLREDWLGGFPYCTRPDEYSDSGECTLSSIYVLLLYSPSTSLNSHVIYACFLL